MVKRFVFVSFSIFLIYMSYDTIGALARVDSIEWPWIIFAAWVINMLVTGIFAISGFVLPTQRLLPASYYAIHQPKRLLKCFRLFRVEIFQKFLLATLWRSKQQNKTYFNGTAAGMTHLEVQSQKSEFGLLIRFLLLIFISTFFVLQGKTALGVSTLIINILGNFYPILLQRHHRWRISRIRQRYQ